MKTKSLEIEVTEEDVLDWMMGITELYHHNDWAVGEIFLTSCSAEEGGTREEGPTWAIVLKAREGEGESP